MQCCPRGSRQHCTGKNPDQGQHSAGNNLVQCRGSRQHCSEKILSNLVLILLEQHGTGKILFNVVLILLGQHCTGKYSMRCCP